MRVPGGKRVTTSEAVRGADHKTVGLLTRYQPETTGRTGSGTLAEAMDEDSVDAGFFGGVGAGAAATRLSSLRSTTA